MVFEEPYLPEIFTPVEEGSYTLGLSKLTVGGFG